MNPAPNPGRVIITGGGSSVGLALVQIFQTNGWSVFTYDIDSTAIDHLKKTTPDIYAASVDGLDISQVETFFQSALQKAGGIDVLINTIGLEGPRAPIEDTDYEDWDKTLRGSVGTAFYTTKQVVPAMKRQGHGRIINFSSSSTRTRLPYRSAYVAAKFALEGLTLNLARELGPHNITVNAILPGPIDNQRLRSIMARNALEKNMSIEDYENAALRFVSMRTKISPEEIARTAYFLSSPAAQHITGQLLAVDGNSEWEE